MAEFRRLRNNQIRQAFGRGLTFYTFRRADPARYYSTFRTGEHP